MITISQMTGMKAAILSMTLTKAQRKVHKIAKDSKLSRTSKRLLRARNNLNMHAKSFRILLRKVNSQTVLKIVLSKII